MNPVQTHLKHAARLSLSTFAPLAALLLCAAVTTRAGWRESKPVFGGQVMRVVADAGGTLYASTTGGLLQSNDGGDTWGPTPGALPTTNILTTAPDPVEVGVLYVSTDLGLYRTADAGATWERLPLNLPGGAYVNHIAVAPADRDRLFVSTWGAYVYRSLDRGATWEQRSAGLSGGWGGPAFVTSIAVDPADADRVYTSTWRGHLFRSEDAATTWARIGDAGTWANNQIHVARSSPNVLYTTHDEYWFGRGTILRSADYGNTWSNVGRPDGAGASEAYELAVDPADANVVYAASSVGIHKTTAGGGSWPRVFSPPAGQPYMPAVAVEPGDPSRVLAGSYYTGFYRSADGGATWAQHNAGIAAASVTGLAVAQSAPATLYMGAQTDGYFKSTDGGLTWNPMGAAYFAGHGVGALSVSPQDPDALVLSTYSGGTSRLWRSADGGASFAVTSAGYGPSHLRHNRHNPSLIHGALSDWQGGFLLSNNGGASWFVPYFWYIYPSNFDFHPTSAGVAFNAGHQYTGAPLNTAHVIWSNNAGSSWAGVAFGQGDMKDIALDQNNPSVLYVAGTLPGEGSRGVYKFNVGYSGGSVASVTRVPGVFNSGLPNPTVRRLAYDAAGGYLYASTPNGVYRSSDQAATWQSINEGLPYPSTDLLALTPDGTRLYVGTSAGVWEYSDSLPVGTATPTVSTSPAGLLQQAVRGETLTLEVVGETTTGADTVTLSASALPANMTFAAPPGNPAAGTVTFTPGGNQEGETYAVTFTAASTLDPSKSSSLTRYFSVVGDASTDASALVSTNSSGVVSTPDEGFRMALAPGSIPSAAGLATVNVISDLQSNSEGARIEVAGRRGRARVLAAYDITIDGQIHFTFAHPVALTFRVEPGAVSNLSDVRVMVYNEATGLYEQRADTSCLAAFGLQPYTGDAASGGTISVCTTTVSLWAAFDLSSFAADSCDADPTQPACPQGCVQPPAGMVAWWTADGNALDTAGGHHGAPRNGAAFAAGKVGQAFGLDGVDDYVRFGDIFDGLNGGFTLDAWVRTTATVGNKAIVAKYWTTGGSWVLRTNENDPAKVDFTVCSPDCTSMANAVQLTSASNINDGDWHFIAATFDGTTQRLYVDGVLEASGTNTNPAWTDSHHFCIGSYCDSGGNSFLPFGGLIDEVEVFGRALSPSEVQAIYDAGAAGKCKGDISAEAGEGACSAEVNVGTPAVGDNCPGATVEGVRSDGQPLGAPYPVGTTTITWTAADAAGNTATASQTVTVEDNGPPVVTPPANVVVGADADSCSAVIDPGAAAASDNCGVQSIVGVRSDSQPLSAPYPVGTTTINWTATDVHGNAASASQTVTVNDAQGPAVSGLAASPASLWPANHSMRDVTVSYDAADNCGGAVNCVISSVTSNEPADGTGDGDTAPDWLVVGAHRLRLRAERAGGGPGRVYTIAVACTDAAGNTTTKTVTVNVPKSRGK